MTSTHLLRAGLALALLASAACSGGGEPGAGGGAAGDTSGGASAESVSPDSEQIEPPRGNPDSLRAVMEQQRREAGTRDEPMPEVANEPGSSGYAECMEQAKAAPTADERAVLASACHGYPDAPK